MKQRAALCLIALVLASADFATAEDLASLREKIANNLSTIASIEVRYQTSPLKAAFQKRFGQKRSAPGLEKPRTEVWIKQGVREFFELEAIQNSETKQYERKLLSFDGHQFFEAHFSPDDPSFINSLDIRKIPRRDQFIKASIPALLVGLHVWETPLTLIELLNRPIAAYLGEEDVSGHRCYKIDSGEYEGFTDFTYRTVMWVDPNVDLLPRKIEILVVRDQKTNAPVKLPPLVKRLEIQDFQTVTDAALRQKRWFPKFVPSPVVDITIDEVQINHEIDKSRFTPVIPDGTQIIYSDQRESLPGTSRTRTKMEVSGGTKGTEILIQRSEKASAKAREKRLQETQSEFARTARFKWLSMLAVGACVVLVAFVWKRSSKRPK